MAASFLQYCAMCEKQIKTPSSSILYCSQACRRKDAAKPLSASILPAITPYTSPATSRSPSPKRAPFTGTSPAPTPNIRIPSEQHAHKADLDPTEWKPKLPRATSLARQSEAYRYLASFHVGIGGRSLDATGHETLMLGRPGLHGYSASVSDVPSLDSTASTVDGSFDGGVEGYFATRPLRARRDPVYAMSCGVRGDGLVMPLVPEVAVVGGRGEIEGKEGEDLWGKKIIVPSKGAGVGGKRAGLGGLLARKRA